MQEKILWAMIGVLGALIFAAIYTDVSARPNVRYACESDYVAWCGDIKPYTPKARACMRKNKWKLSLNCRKALGNAGYRG